MDHTQLLPESKQGAQTVIYPSVVFKSIKDSVIGGGVLRVLKMVRERWHDTPIVLVWGRVEQ